MNRTIALFLIAFLWSSAACSAKTTPTSGQSPIVTATAGQESTAVPAQAPGTTNGTNEVPDTVSAEPPVQKTEPALETAAGRTFVIIPDESRASYTVEEEFFDNAVTNLGKELGFFTTIGSTDRITGSITLDPESISTIISGQFSVHILSLTSDDNRRDNRIRDQFLESRKFPDAIFTPLTIEGLADDYQEGQVATFQLIGDLTIRDVTQSVSFDVTATLADHTLSGQASVMILMTDFGFDPPEIAGFLEAQDEVLITLIFVARE